MLTLAQTPLMNNQAPDFELMLFENSSKNAHAIIPFGIRRFILDWEHLGKVNRQEGFDTEIKPGRPEDLVAIARIPDALTWCRINRYGSYTRDEIECAIFSGVIGIFLPMVTSPKEVEDFLRIVNHRCQVGILIETKEALVRIDELAKFPLDRVYFGLNDFAISRGGGSIFCALLDGSVESARVAFSQTPFGFGGVTAIGYGFPVPCSRLIEEMARLKCQFSFLRRSYRKDVSRMGTANLVHGVQEYWQYCLTRSEAQVHRDRLALEQCLREVCKNV
jgi:hypothetical protein